MAEQNAHLHKKDESFSENDIRPDDIMEKQKTVMQADIDYMLRSKEEFVHVKCPACGANNCSVAFNKYTLDYCECQECATLYINPRPTEEHLADFYKSSQNYKFWNEHIFPATEAVRREKIFRPRAQRVKEICEKLGFVPKKMVEVGSGFGTFCEEMRSLDFVEEIIAVEPTPALANTCRERGLDVVEKPIEKAEFEDGSIDLVCSFEVLEHLFSPAAFLDKFSKILRPGGLAILTNPNGQGFDVVVAPEHSGAVDVEHLNYFNPSSMKILYERYGFELLEVTTPGKLDAELVRKMFLSGKLERKDNPFLYQLLVDNWDNAGANFQDFIVENKLSSHMWTVVRKKQR